MKQFYVFLCLFWSVLVGAQAVAFEEYTLSNGLHVILHQDNSVPVVAVNVMYHVGSKDENPERTGFAHFFEHLLFEGTKNIERGKWFSLVSENGGSNNAYTTYDVTNYYEVFPSNNLELGLWMEAERMLHPVINPIGVETQNEVVKEEKRMRYDNSPYAQILPNVHRNLFSRHPYRWQPIGSMEHLDAATLDEFLAFNQKFYVPNNAVLVVAGDFQTAQAKQWIDDYFGTIPKGKEVSKIYPKESPIAQTIETSAYDSNIQLPALVVAYRTPAAKTRDAKALGLISSYLSQGQSSILYKKLVDEKKLALQVGAFNIPMENYSTYLIFAIPLGDSSMDTILAEIDEEINRLQQELISERNHQKLHNQYEKGFIEANNSVDKIAENLANYHLIMDSAQAINTDLEEYRSISREELQKTAAEHLQEQQRLVMHYLPESKK